MANTDCLNITRNKPCSTTEMANYEATIRQKTVIPRTSRVTSNYSELCRNYPRVRVLNKASRASARSLYRKSDKRSRSSSTTLKIKSTRLALHARIPNKGTYIRTPCHVKHVHHIPPTGHKEFFFSFSIHPRPNWTSRQSSVLFNQIFSTTDLMINKDILFETGPLIQADSR